MIIDDLRKIITQNQKADNKTYLLNLLKEGIQSYILYFIYTSGDFKELIFTGGTCLRRVFGLNRLSVDLDFDYESGSNPKEIFAGKIEEWFRREHQVSGVDAILRKDTVKVKFSETARLFEGIGKEVIFVSVDLSPVSSKNYNTEHNLVSTPEFSFIVKNYDLPTMFANKICAFLSRDFTFGKGQVVSFKARDVYDLFWLCQRSKQNQYKLRPNFDTISERMDSEDRTLTISRLIDKIELLDGNQLAVQLLPFFSDKQFVSSFISTYRETLVADLKNIFGDSNAQ